MMHGLLSIKVRIIELLREFNSTKFFLYGLIRRDLLGKYSNSLLGLAWHVVMPVIMIVIYYTAFSALNAQTIDNYWIYLCIGVFPFFFMSNNLIAGSACVSSNSNLVTKISFPRIYLVIAHVISTAIVMLIGNTITFILMIITEFPINIVALYYIPIVIMMMFFAFGYTLFFSSMNVYYRDFQYFLSSISIVFFIITPIYFMTSNISGSLETIVWLNPFTYFLELFHEVLYYGNTPSFNLIIISLMMTIISMIVGLSVFYRLNKGFAERM